ncbi:hypothetical protein [Nocardioides sp.]|uniref:hypothetical protein n=1 Tax=Nocardioides sp. TaxID=35761 RepID=UPI0039E27AF9
MAVESDGHSRGNPRMYELFESAPPNPPKGSGKSPTIRAFPQVIDFLKVSGQPVQGPWPPHQQPRPDPDDVEAGPIAVPDPQSQPRHSTESAGTEGQ